jgi:hypothetical protein
LARRVPILPRRVVKIRFDLLEGGFLMRLSTVLTLLAVLGFTGTAHAAGAQVPLPPSLVFVVTGAAGIAGYAWWVRRK